MPRIYTDDSDIIWNAIANRWEISFDVKGFSGFYVKTQLASLPVYWLQCNGYLNLQQQAVLNWEVAEYNVAAYYIEKSEDGRSFRVIDRIAGKGEGTHSYQYTGTEKIHQNTWYRIRQEDIDGTATYSQVLKLAPGGSEGSLGVYPNPVKDNLNIIGAVRGSSAQLIDLHGRILSAVVFTGSPQWLNMAGYAPGIYLLKTSSGQTYKILKK